MSEEEVIPDWERIQRKTFTKWVNTHLKREFGDAAMVKSIILHFQMNFVHRLVPCRSLNVVHGKQTAPNYISP